MDEFLNFVTENYIWIIIIGIVILMTIIGYIADKTDFGKESLKKNKVKKEKDVAEFDNNDEPNVTEAFNTDELEVSEEETNIPSKKELRRMKKEEARKQKEELKKQREEEKKQREEEKRLKEEAKLNNQENKYDENEQIQTNSQEEIDSPESQEAVTETPKNDIFNEPFSFEEPETKTESQVQDTHANIFTEPEVYEHKDEPKSEVPTESKEDSKNDLDEIPEIELPSIESLDEELKDDEEDDVWKF